MKKDYIILVVVVGLLIFGFFFFKNQKTEIVANNCLNTTYKIDGKEVKLINGKAETESTSDSSRVITQYFGNELKKDFDGDGSEDLIFLLTQQMGGSGTFYYVVGCLNTKDSFVGSHGLFLGDRIAPQSTKTGEGNVVVVNYADRKVGESFAIRPSVGKSIWLLLNPETMQFGEVVQDFEGEADPAMMTLDMKTWTWIITAYSNDLEVRPLNEKKFTLTFKSDNTFSATTDCNSVGGEYTVKKNQISFNKNDVYFEVL